MDGSLEELNDAGFRSGDGPTILHFQELISRAVALLFLPVTVERYADRGTPSSDFRPVRPSRHAMPETSLSSEDEWWARLKEIAASPVEHRRGLRTIVIMWGTCPRCHTETGYANFSTFRTV